MPTSATKFRVCQLLFSSDFPRSFFCLRLFWMFLLLGLLQRKRLISAAKRQKNAGNTLATQSTCPWRPEVRWIRVVRFLSYYLVTPYTQNHILVLPKKIEENRFYKTKNFLNDMYQELIQVCPLKSYIKKSLCYILCSCKKRSETNESSRVPVLTLKNITYV